MINDLYKLHEKFQKRKRSYVSENLITFDDNEGQCKTNMKKMTK